MLRVDVLTLFPEVFESFLGSSIVGRAIASGLVRVRCVNYRDFASDRHRSVDDHPFGGGPGMVMMCGPVFDAVESITRECDPHPLLVMLTPQGERLSQSLVHKLSASRHLLLMCGHYEGFDERIRDGLTPREVSIGDYVLSGGEPAAMVLIDAMVRLLPGALGDEASTKEESFSAGLLEYAQYTKPRSFRGMEVPEVLLSGHHARIESWRYAQSLERTRRRRPDLLTDANDSNAPP